MVNETPELIFTVAGWENKASYRRDKAGSILLPAPCQANTHPHTGSGIRRGCFQSLFPLCIEQFPSSASSSSPMAIKPANKESLGTAGTAPRDLPQTKIQKKIKKLFGFSRSTTLSMLTHHNLAHPNNEYPRLPPRGELQEEGTLHIQSPAAAFPTGHHPLLSLCRTISAPRHQQHFAIWLLD